MAKPTQLDEPSAVEPMGLRSIGGHALIYGIGMLANRALSFVMLPVYTRYLTPADYGIVSLVEMTFDVLSIVAGARLAVGVYRFYHKAETEDGRRRVVTTALLLTSLLAVPFGLLAVISAGPLSELVFDTLARGTSAISPAEGTAFFIIGGFGFVAQGFQIVPFAYLQLTNRSRFYVGLQFGRSILQATLNVILLVVMGLGPIALLISLLIANILTGAVLCAVVWHDCGMRFDRESAGDLIRYGAPLMLTQVATFVITFGDRFFLQYFRGEAAVGLYAMSYQFGFLMATLAATPFQMIWNPIRFDIVKRADRDDMHARAFIYFNVLLFAVATGIGLFVGDALRVLTTPDFFAAADVVPVILLAYVFHSWLFQDVGILVAEKTSYIALANWISAALIVTGYVVLIPPFGPWGAASATLIAMAVRWIILYVISQRLLYIRYRWRPVVAMMGMAALVVTVSSVLPTMRLVPSLAVNTLLFLIWVASVPLLRVLSPDEIRSMVSWVLDMARPLWQRLRPPAPT